MKRDKNHEVKILDIGSLKKPEGYHRVIMSKTPKCSLEESTMKEKYCKVPREVVPFVCIRKPFLEVLGL